MARLDGQLVTIFGGGGFIGRYVAEKLLGAGARVRIAERNPKNAFLVKPLGDLGQTQFASADVTNADSVARAVRGSHAVVNLVGIFGSDMMKVHVDGARNVAQAAAEAGTRSFVHVSAIGADPQSPSQYGRSKAQGEKAVREAFPDAIILRPSVVFGREDEFVNRFAGLITMLPVVPVIGGDTKFQPVFVGDVAAAAKAALADPDAHGGATYELGGPEVISMRELNERIAAMTGRERTFIDVPDIAAKAMSLMPGSPMSHDQYKMLGRDNVVAAKAHTLGDLGVSPTPLGAVAPRWLDKYRAHGRFGSDAKAS